MKKNPVVRVIDAIKFLAKNKKITLVCYVLAVAFFPAKLFVEMKGRDFPAESDLTYSTGVLAHHLTMGKNSKSFLILKDIKDQTDMVYGCSYTAITTSTTRSCMRQATAEPYLGKAATVGWYKQSDFLVFSNNLPQLVTLTVEGEPIIAYEKTVAKNKRSNKIHFFFAIFAALFAFGIVSFLNWAKYREIPYTPPKPEK